MVRAPEHHGKKMRTPLRTLLTWKAELGKLKEIGPSSNLKRNPPQSDSDWGRIPLDIWMLLDLPLASVVGLLVLLDLGCLY